MRSSISCGAILFSIRGASPALAVSRARTVMITAIILYCLPPPESGYRLNQILTKTQYAPDRGGYNLSLVRDWRRRAPVVGLFLAVMVTMTAAPGWPPARPVATRRFTITHSATRFFGPVLLIFASQRALNDSARRTSSASTRSTRFVWP